MQAVEQQPMTVGRLEATVEAPQLGGVQISSWPALNQPTLRWKMGNHESHTFTAIRMAPSTPHPPPNLGSTFCGQLTPRALDRELPIDCPFFPARSYFDRSPAFVVPADRHASSFSHPRCFMPDK
jgi:hypothetical protein